jgi:hypothetical protein
MQGLRNVIDCLVFIKVLWQTSFDLHTLCCTVDKERLNQVWTAIAQFLFGFLPSSKHVSRLVIQMD